MTDTGATTPARRPASTLRGPLLTATGLGRRFGAVTALDQVDLVLTAGARCAVIGPNGAGKTTLLSVLAGTLRPTTGTIRLHGRDITRHNAARRARAGIARSFQTPTLFPTLSTVDNLVVAAWRHLRPHLRGVHRYRQLKARALDQLDMLHLSQHADRLAGELPHGQQRLLDIGMALISHPTVLLLDEPAAGLDSDHDLERLLTLLKALPPITAVVLVEHHMDVVAAVAHTVIWLRNGTAHAGVAPHELAEHHGLAPATPGPQTATVGERAC